MITTDFHAVNASMATDCSGLGVPELAMEAIAQQYGMEYRVVFACDHLQASQAFLRRNIQPVHLLGDIGERVFRTSSFATTAVDGKAQPTNNSIVALCGLSCHVDCWL